VTRLVVLSGLSGSGKTLAAKTLEDMGYFSVDNLPAPLIGPFVDLLDRGEAEEPRGAFVVDAREREHLETLPEAVESLRSRKDTRLTVIFLEAADETLARRFQASRRPHPLARDLDSSLAESIREERRVLTPLREIADQIISTDDLSPHDLRRLLMESLREDVERAALQCKVVSFGFKYGGVRDADMVFDVRFLANPYFDHQLKSLSGMDAEVVEFLEAQDDDGEFMSRLEGLLAFILPRFVHEGKSYLTIAIGCTGGRHRSVAIGERMVRFLGQRGYPATVSHRDLLREAERAPS